ncbi:MAG: cysteine--tRNA ligase [Armatimonadota bacterium]|nr:cysteine--tRNA ligase [Armatimonadota bacterium]
MAQDMGIRLYNTLTRAREDFVPSTPGRVAFYVCGLTVQGPAHLGHARSAVAFDAIRRHFEYRGYSTRLIYNFTDVDDKIIEKAAAEGIPYLQVAERNIQSFRDQLAALKVKPADVFPRATEHIGEMLEMVKTLVDRGHAYAVGGDVYFNVPSYPDYGKLSNRPLEEMRPGERIELDVRKRSPLDFTLWKAARPGEPSWESPWGPGRPGWHIECSAMSLKYLGNAFDIHGGGEDLIFPHHENELAQSNCFTGSDVFARYWMHNAYVNLGSGKMSKSEGNVVNISELLRKYGAPVLRLYLLSTHYRHPIMFKWEELDAQARSVERVRLAIHNARRVLQGAPKEAAAQVQGSGDSAAVSLAAQARESLTRFETAMDDDFNTPSALAAIFDLVSEINRLVNDPGFRPDGAVRESLEGALATHRQMTEILQVFTEDDTAAGTEEKLVPGLLDLLITLRAEARARRDFATGDTIRTALKEMGIVLEDHREGTSWRVIDG